MHRLDGAHQRIDRAEEHLNEVRLRCEAHGQAIRQTVAIERKPATFRFPDGREVQGVLGQLSGQLGPVPDRVSILVGETIYNLRAALDYLVYELALCDAGEVRFGTQFPIESTEKGFVRRRPNYLNGVSQAHIAAIKWLQPYKGCNWTARLRDISNPDKHSHLTILASPIRLSPAPGSTQRIIAGEAVDVESDVSVLVAFSDGTPVVETLEQLLASVAQTLQAFDPDFK